MKETQYEDLTTFHKSKVFDRAFVWRKEHHWRVLKLMSGIPPDQLKPAPPTGSAIFDPSQWSGSNWVWFSELLMKRIEGWKKHTRK